MNFSPGNYLIIIAGLPGVGKTTAGKKLSDYLNYEFIEQNEVRREAGMRRMPKQQDAILRIIDQNIRKHLDDDRGVIVDSVHRYTGRRNQMYGVASCCKKRVITLEILYPEEKAKMNIRHRPVKGRGLISDPVDPKVYDKLAELWEDIERFDFKYPMNSHVSYAIYDREKNLFKKRKIQRGDGRIIKKIESALCKIIVY